MIEPELSAEAAEDLITILEESVMRWGEQTSTLTQERITVALRKIAGGLTLGHRHRDVAVERIRCVHVKPFLIFFDEERRLIVRIVHGHRDIGSLFGPGLE